MPSHTPQPSVDSFDTLSPISQRSNYGFPQYDSSQRFGGGSRYNPRRASNASFSSIASTTNSIGGSLDIQIQRPTQTVKETSQNAISTLLQPPMVRTGHFPHPLQPPLAHKAPTAKDIPPVTLTNIPHVEPTAFKDYLTRIGPLLESFQRARAETQSSKQNEEPLASPDKIGDTPVRPTVSRQNSLATLSPIRSPLVSRRSSGIARRRPHEPTPLSTIPTVYFEENFQLENPRTFDVVSERAEIVRPPPGAQTEEKHANGTALPPRKSLATNAILQEKLSWYMDTVEVHLISSISSASTSFFATLGSLRDLQSEAADSVARIKKLRADLARLNENMALGGLDIAEKRRKRENVRKLAQAAEQVGHIVEDVKHCEVLADRGEYEAAADGIARVERLIAGQPQGGPLEPGRRPSVRPDHDLLDLRGLRAIQGLSQGMQQLQYRIGKGFEARFLETMLFDLRQHVDRVAPKETLRRWASASQRSRGDQNRIQTGPPAYLETNEQFREALLASLNGLSRSGHTAQATAAFRDAVMKEMKSLIRKHLPSSNDDDNESVTSVSTRGGRQLNQQEKSAILARNLRALDDEAAEELLVNVYTSVSEALRRLGVQIKVLLDVTSSIGSRPSTPDPAAPPRSPNMQPFRGQFGNTSQSPVSRGRHLQEELSQALDMSSLLGQSVDIAQTQITRVLKVRAEQSSRLPLERFLRYFTLNRLFADECEAVSGRSGQMLKGLINTQITGFVHTLGDAENQKTAQQLDADQWEAKDFKDEDNVVLSRIMQGMTSDPAVWTRGTHIWEDASSNTVNGLTATSDAANGAANGKPLTRAAYIDETRFILISSAMTLLPTIDAFLGLIASIPSIASAAVPALADILRTFNSRSCQLILGAGATRSAGLKNITTKHLALASQALSFVVVLIPYLRETVRRHVGGRGEMLAEFDKVKRLYQEHQMGIHDKLVEIMTARANAHVNAMKKINFDAEVKDVGAASPYMETLSKETGTLYRVLGKHLSEPDVQGIMSQIFASYREQWSRAFREVEVKTNSGKDRLLKDAELFDARLGKVEGFGEIGKTVIAIVKAKDVTVKTTVEEKKEDVGPESAATTNGKKSEA